MLPVLMLIASCNLPANTNNTPPATTESHPPSPIASSQSEQPYVIPNHDIATRIVNGQAEFYNRQTGERFIPIGPNFHLLGPENDYFVDRLFSPAHYDSNFIGEQFDIMKSLGYNVVRTSLDVCADDCIGARDGGLRQDYLDNIANFIRQAKEHGLYVIITSNDLPKYAGYIPKVEATCCDPFDGYMNSHYLSPVGVEQWSNYWQEVVQAFIEREVPLDAIMAYQIRGELFLFEDTPPLSLTNGMVTTANGNTYDMSDPDQKQLMVDQGVRYWVDSVADTIHDLDPTALITIGLFPPNSPHVWRPGDTRLVPPVTAFSDSNADFIDLHPYPGYLPLDQLMDNFAVSGFTEKPLVIGEFGGFTFVYGSPQSAAFGLQDWQTGSCAYGIQGWMYWHWTGKNDHEVWTGSENNGVIRETLAPINRPDPCAPQDFDFFENNLALGKPVRVSRFLPEAPGSFAVDGWNSTIWQSGAGPSQWIEVDLEGLFTIQAIRAFTSQYPEGNTIHQIYVAGSDHNLRLVYEFNGFTRGEEQLEYIFPKPLDEIQYVRLVTTQSPSWVSWKEITILGE
jgi:hypothetical protein